MSTYRIAPRGNVWQTTEDQDVTADHSSYGWSVTDSSGGRWWPDEVAQAEIESAEDPAAAILRICASEPLRGTWHS